MGWIKSGRLRRQRRLFAVEHDQLGIDRAGIEQRLGRRLVISSRPGVSALPSGCRDRLTSRHPLEPELVGQLERRLVLRRDDRPDRCRVGGSLRPSRTPRRQASEAIPWPCVSAGHDPAHFGLFAELRLEIAPGGEQAGVADQLPVRLLRSTAQVPKPLNCQLPTDAEQSPPAILRASSDWARSDDAPRAGCKIA